MGGNSGRKVRPQVVGSEDSRPRRIIATGQALAQPESRSWVERRLIDAQLTAIEEASPKYSKHWIIRRHSTRLRQRHGHHPNR